MAVTLKLFVLLVAFCYSVNAGATREQMEASARMVRGVCQPKTKVTEEAANAMRDGVFADDKPAKCYIHCMLEMMAVMKKNKVNVDGALKQFDALLTDDVKEVFKGAVVTCKDATNNEKNGCDAAYHFIKCFKQNNPLFEFP